MHLVTRVHWENNRSNKMISHSQTHDAARIALAVYIQSCGCTSNTEVACALAAMLGTVAKLAIDAQNKNTSLEMLRAVSEMIAKPETRNNTGIQIVQRQCH
ncbi:hypothetical protein [Pseudomonas canadensis]|uniref:hypothetical protein n=1 Tax=Pseudomonas canadensis TaxID=915099 RepID=UPI0027334D9C|nr:hypothetical protein [Pseudomonas canadensis]WLH27441.1 hypothetical protein PSH56_15315 [Pseudomonas canadensis]